LAVVVQVINNVGVVVCAVTGVIMVADVVVEACVQEKRSDPGHASGGVLDSRGDVVIGGNGLRNDGHDESDRRGRKT
jgi:hypothetical protein